MLKIRPVNAKDKVAVTSLLCKNWGSDIIVTRGKTHDASSLPGFIAEVEGVTAGLITYCTENGECEIVTLDSFMENRGVGSSLIEAVVNSSTENNCNRVWLITTNDNTRAIRYYQRRGFTLANVHIDAVKRAREIKPQIPIFGFDDIPILHEIEFEKRL